MKNEPKKKKDLAKLDLESTRNLHKYLWFSCQVHGICTEVQNFGALNKNTLLSAPTAPSVS
jgi:hypothetical protein